MTDNTDGHAPVTVEVSPETALSGDTGGTET